MVKEWNLLRTVAALSIVLLHSTTFTSWNIGNPGIDNYQFYRLLLTFATPTFIILSIIILANRYNDRIPDDFFKKRAKLILLPFISFSIIDSVVTHYISNGIDIPQRVFTNLLGGFEGYFILIIFQFYILHYLVVRYKLPVKKFVPISIVVMVTHLIIVYKTGIVAHENKEYFKLLITGWLGYFTVGFMIGKHYDVVKDFLRNYKWMTLIIFVFALYFMYLSFSNGNTQIHSKRIDIFVLTIAANMFILAWGQIIPNLKVINLISNYSLGIYLLHWQVQRVIAPYVADYVTSPSIMIVTLFLVSLVLSMIIIKLITLLPFGKFIVGNTTRKFGKNSRPANNNDKSLKEKTA